MNDFLSGTFYTRDLIFLKPHNFKEKITDKTLFVDVIADYIQNWLEDNINTEIQDEMKKTVEQFSNKQKFDSSVVTLFSTYLNTRADSFEQQISKTKE